VRGKTASLVRCEKVKWVRSQLQPHFGPADPQIRNKAKSRRLKFDQVDYREGALQLLFDKLFSEND
jgi:hypothetical protein